MSEGLRTNPILRSVIPSKPQTNTTSNTNQHSISADASYLMSEKVKTALRPLEGNSLDSGEATKGAKSGGVPKSRVPSTRMTSAAAVVRGGSSPRKEVRSPAQRAAASGGDEFATLERLDQMDSVMDYIVSITAAVAQRTRSMPPPDSLVQFRASVAPGSRFTPQADQTEHYSLLSDLHDTSNLLLSWFSKLEYGKATQEAANARDLERETLATSAQVIALVEKVERKFAMHEDGRVREAFERRRPAVQDCRELLDTLTQATQLMVLIRRQTESQNVQRAEDLLEGFKRMVQQSERSGTACAWSTTYLRAVLNGPFFVWLETRWLAAMRGWTQLMQRAREKAAAGEVAAALAQAEQDMLLIPGLQEILRPRETLSDLFEAELRIPLTQERERLARDLRDAVASGSLDALSEAIRAATAYYEANRPTPEEQTALAEATAQVEAIQEAAELMAAMQAALDDTELPLLAGRLFVRVHEANEYIHRHRLAVSCSRAQKTVRVCRPVAEALSRDRTQPLSKVLPISFEMAAVRISHMYSNAWAAPQSGLYNRLCERLFTVYARESDEDAGAAAASHSCSARAPRTSSRSNRKGSQQQQQQLGGAKVLKMKVHYNAHTRIFAIPITSTFATVHGQLRSFCAEIQDSSEPLRVRYEDGDGDFITVLNEKDWELCLEEVAAGKAGAKVDVFCDFPAQPSDDASPMLTPTPGPSLHASPEKLRLSNNSARHSDPKSAGAVPPPPTAPAAAPVRGRQQAVTQTRSSKLRAASANCGARVNKTRPSRPASVASRRGKKSAAAAAAPAPAAAPAAAAVEAPSTPPPPRTKRAAAPLVPRRAETKTKTEAEPEREAEAEAPPAVPESFGDVVRLQVAEARCWSADAELQILEMQTTASGRSSAAPETRTTTTAPVPAAVAKPPSAESTPVRQPAQAETKPPCGAASSPKSLALSMLPPRPQSAAASPKNRARTRSGRRGTPHRRGCVDGLDDSPQQHSMDLLAEMDLLRMRNLAAMQEAEKKCS